MQEISFDQLIETYFDKVQAKRSPYEMKLVLKRPYPVERWFIRGKAWIGPGGKIVEIREKSNE